MNKKPKFSREVRERGAEGRGRRGAIDYTASGLANRVYGIAYPDRL